MDLLQQINELQEVVAEMKGSLTEAMMKLGGVVDDSDFEQKINEAKQKCETNSAEILKLVLSLKSDFSYLKKEVGEVKERQDSLNKAVNILLEDRRSLATDLSQAGVISQHTRTRLECVTGVVEAVGTHARTASGSHSNDSGVALLLEKANSAFADDPNANQGQRASDQDSLPDHPSLLVPPSVYDYVAGLSQPSYSLQSANSSYQYPSLPNEQSDTSLTIKDDQRQDNQDSGMAYDSDSSLTIAANKSISLSTCLSQEIRVNEQQSDTRQNSRSATLPTDSQCKDHHTVNGRRRRPLLGISSTAMYQPTHHLHAPTREKSTHHHRHRHKKDPQESLRYRVARELLDTEKKYCKTLWTIQDTFAEPLKRAGLLSNKDIATLFPSEVYQLYDKHCLLQHQLRERLGSWKYHPIIGDILSRFTDPHQNEVLRLYTTYVNDFPEVLKTFHRLCKTSPIFTSFIKSCLEQPACGGLDLGAFLLSPVQRVPRYILLMKQLLKYTESSHADYKHLNICLDRLRDFLARLNDAMEHSFRLVNSSLSPSVVLNSGIHGTEKNSKQSNSESSQGSPTHSHQSEYSGQPSSSSEEGRSPQRSLSSASQLRNTHAPPGRSSSLPRTSIPSDTSNKDQKTYETFDGHRSRSETAGRKVLTVPPVASALKKSAKCRPLTTARSVTDVTKAESHCKYGDLAASEPSLLDSALQVPERKMSENGVRSTTPKLVTWTDPVNTIEDRAKKKGSIKTSIKNMFLFKKRAHGYRDKEEQIYWPTSVSDITAHIPSHSPPPANYSTSLRPAIGDFVDEDGNPCSNV